MRLVGFFEIFYPLLIALTFAFVSSRLKFYKLFGQYCAVIGFFLNIHLLFFEIRNSLHGAAKLSFSSPWIEGPVFNFFGFPGMDYTFHLSSSVGWFLLLGSILVLVAITTSLKNHIFSQNVWKMYCCCVFLIQWFFGMAISSKNLFGFFIFSELAILPLFIILVILGGKKEKKTTFRFLVHSSHATVLFLIPIVFLSATSLNVFGDYNLILDRITSLSPGFWVFCCFLAGIFLKVGLFPVFPWPPLLDNYFPLGVIVTLHGFSLLMAIFFFCKFLISSFSAYMINIFPWITIILIILIGGQIWFFLEEKKRESM